MSREWRKLSKSRAKDKALNRCSMLAIVLHERLITHADDAGRHEGEARMLLGLFLRNADVSVADIESARDELRKHELIAMYRDPKDSAGYIQLKTDSWSQWNDLGPKYADQYECPDPGDCEWIDRPSWIPSGDHPDAPAVAPRCPRDIPAVTPESHSDGTPAREEKRREDDDVEIEISTPEFESSSDPHLEQVEELFEHWNNQHGRSYPTRYGGTLTTGAKNAKARLEDGSTLEDLKLVVDHAERQWADDEYMHRYRRPTTLFRKSKFPEYLEEAKDFIKSPPKARGQPGAPGGKPPPREFFRAGEVL